jgi:hypothetical protein
MEKFLKVSAMQVQKNREGIRDMWKKIPGKWIELDTFLYSHQYDPDGTQRTRHELAKICDGKGGPHNTCEAVGCFAGWNWTYHPYQNWCKRHDLLLGSTANLAVFLGLEHQNHPLFDGRHHYDMSQNKDVTSRIKDMMDMPVYPEAQPVYTLEGQAGRSIP